MSKRKNLINTGSYLKSPTLLNKLKQKKEIVIQQILFIIYHVYVEEIVWDKDQDH